MPFVVNEHSVGAGTDGFVLVPGDRAVIATWIRADGIWYAGQTTRAPDLRNFSEVTGYVTAHSVTDETTPAGRLRLLAGYLALDWSWLTRRCAGLSRVGCARLIQPHSRLLSTQGIDAALQFAGRIAAGRGRAILASSRESESSYVLPAAANRLFTRHLLDGLKGGIPSEDGLIRVFDLFEYVQPRVTRDQPDQHPVFRADLEENFPVALGPEGSTGAAPRDEEGFRYDAYLSYADGPRTRPGCGRR